jgi:ankyrin repeat protein
MDSPLTDSLGALTITDEIGDSILHRATRCGDISVTQKFIEINHEDDQSLLNSRNTLGQTPLLLACIAGEFSTAEILLEAGASAAIPDNEGDTPLHWLHAFEKPSIPSIAASLVSRGARIHAYSGRNEKDAFSQKILAAGTPLHRAAAWNNGEAVRVLLDHGADPLRSNSGHGWHELSTPLWSACTFHNSEAVKAILLHLSKTKDVASIVNDGERREWPFLMPVFDLGYYYSNGGMLGRMARHGELYSRATEDTIQALKSHGASMLLPGALRRPGIPGHPALTSAILLRCTDVVRIMLHISPESIEQWDPKFMQPPLHFAAQQDRADIVELLLSSGADPHARNGNGITALANYTNYQSGLEIPRLLLKHGVQYELPSNGFQTPFFGAIARGSFELADFVLENTRPEHRNKMINASCSRGPSFSTEPPGVTILGYLLLICHQSLPMVLRRLFRLVHKFGENVNVIVDPGQERTAFHVLAEREPGARIDPVIAAVANEIIRQCAVKDSLDLLSKKGKPALWYAVRYMNYDLIDCLLGAGANPNVADHQGVSPLDLLRNQVTHTKEHHEGTREQGVVESVVKLFRSYEYTLTEVA